MNTSLVGQIVSSQDLLKKNGKYEGMHLRMLRFDEYRSSDNPNGAVLPKPRLQRAVAATSPTYGDHALQEDGLYTWGGCDNHTAVFVDDRNNVPIQLFCHEIPCVCFEVTA